MNELLAQKSLRELIPGAFIFLVSLMPFFFPPSTHLFLPNLAAGALYFWAVSGPEKISLWVIFGAGLLQDGLSGAPIGLYGCLNLLLWALTFAHRKYLFKKAFLTGWFGFLILYSIMLILKACMAWFLQRSFYANAIIYEGLITLLSYPLITAGCFYIDQKSL